MITGMAEHEGHGALAREALPAVIDEFRGRWAFLSNFHPAVLEWEGITYPTSEHAFNAGKTLDLDVRQHIAGAPTPGEAKRRGRSVQLRVDWDERVRYQVMAEVLNAKFGDHAERVDALLSTGDALLVESNKWHDQTWGTCLCGRKSCARRRALTISAGYSWPYATPTPNSEHGRLVSRHCGMYSSASTAGWKHSNGRSVEWASYAGTLGP